MFCASPAAMITLPGAGMRTTIAAPAALDASGVAMSTLTTVHCWANAGAAKKERSRRRTDSALAGSASDAAVAREAALTCGDGCVLQFRGAPRTPPLSRAANTSLALPANAPSARSPLRVFTFTSPIFISSIQSTITPPKPTHPPHPPRRLTAPRASRNNASPRPHNPAPSDATAHPAPRCESPDSAAASAAGSTARAPAP